MRITFRKHKSSFRLHLTSYEIFRDKKMVGMISQLECGLWYMYAVDSGPLLNTSHNPKTLDEVKRHARDEFKRRVSE